MFGWANARERKDGKVRSEVMEIEYPYFDTSVMDVPPFLRSERTNDDLSEILLRIGVIQNNGLDIGPIDDGHIRDYMVNEQLVLEPWEVRALVAASRKAVSVYKESSEKPDYLPPWGNRDAMRGRVDAELKAAFKSLSSGGKK